MALIYLVFAIFIITKSSCFYKISLPSFNIPAAFDLNLNKMFIMPGFAELKFTEFIFNIKTKVCIFLRSSLTRDIRIFIQLPGGKMSRLK